MAYWRCLYTDLQDHSEVVCYNAIDLVGTKDLKKDLLAEAPSPSPSPAKTDLTPDSSPSPDSSTASLTSITLIFTIILGIYFTFLHSTSILLLLLQIAFMVQFFLVATGFHGIHVIIGTLFLIINLLRNTKAHFSNNHHLRFEIAA